MLEGSKGLCKASADHPSGSHAGSWGLGFRIYEDSKVWGARRLPGMKLSMPDLGMQCFLASGGLF